jgi:hypothetical protein
MREPDVAHVSWKLNESLRACQAMVANYRLMLRGEANDNQALESELAEAVRTSDAEEA